MDMLAGTSRLLASLLTTCSVLALGAQLQGQTVPAAAPSVERALPRHAAVANERGFQARNPGQAWLTDFDGRGFLTRPDSRAWTWGLELSSWGFAGHERSLGGSAQVSAAGGRVAYDWGGDLEEWYVNDARGLEHGYSVPRRPRCGASRDRGPLLFHLAVRGDLRAVLDDDGRGVRFLDEADRVALSYVGLHAFDADGRPLEAGFSLLEEGLLLSVSDAGARYPLTIDPLAQQAYFKASNTQFADRFGTAVAISGDIAVVGAPEEDGASTGVNGSQGNGASLAGAAYVFVREGGVWSQQAYLKASNTGADDHFGESVAISGETIVIGAPLERSNATGVNGNQNNNNFMQAGAAYVFTRSAGVWTQQAYLKASNTNVGDAFGGSPYASSPAAIQGGGVAISGDTIVVGALREGSSSTGINGLQSDNSALGAGAAYVFVRNGSTWTQDAYLKASNAEAGDSFGAYVSISGDTIAVGAPSEDGGSTGVNGNQASNLKAGSGAAYIFVRSGSSWSQQAYIKASTSGSADNFATVVSVSGNTLAVGAPREDSNATGVNGNEQDNSLNAAGAAYVFSRSGTTWVQEAYLKPSNTDPLEQYGVHLAAREGVVVVGAPFEDSAGAGIDPLDQGNTASNAGAAYVYTRTGSSWSQLAYVKASNAFEHSEFGTGVAISGDLILIGAPEENSDSTGVNGSQIPFGANASGAAYLFDLNAIVTPGVAYCVGDGGGTACPCGNVAAAGEGCANSTGSGAELSALVGFSNTGSASVSAANLILVGRDLVPNQPGLYFQGDNATNAGQGLAFGDGLRCAGGNLARLQVVSASGGGLSNTSIDVAARGGVAAGDTRRYQLWYRDPSSGPCGTGFNLTNGYEIVWTP